MKLIEQTCGRAEDRQLCRDLMMQVETNRIAQAQQQHAGARQRLANAFKDAADHQQRMAQIAAQQAAVPV